MTAEPRFVSARRPEVPSAAEEAAGLLGELGFGLQPWMLLSSRERLRPGWGFGAGGAFGVSPPLDVAGSLLGAGTGAVASDQLAGKGERQPIGFEVRWCSHHCLAKHQGQPTFL